MILTAVFSFFVVPDGGFLAGCPEQGGPVDGIIIAEVVVISDINVTRADLFERLEFQRCKALLLEDKQ